MTLLGLMIATGSLCAGGNHHSRKTFLSSRAPGVNLAMEYTTWHDHVYKGNGQRPMCVQSCSKPCNHPRQSGVAYAKPGCAPVNRCAKPCAPKKLSAHVQVTGFYQDSTNHADIGEYFGIGNGKNSFVVGTEADVLAGTADILGDLLIHNFNGGPLAGTVSFNPNQQMAGVRFDYFQDLNSPICGLFFKARMPLVWVARDMKLHVANSVNSSGGFSLEQFFKGNVTQTAPAEDLQDPLTKAKIDGRRHKFGVADIDLALGHKCVHTDTKHLFFNLGVTIPTGSKVTGEFLFEPVCGNGHHFGIGGGLDAGAVLWCNQHATFRFLAAAEYRYLFEKTEGRTVGVNGRPLGFYFLARRISSPANTALFPAANILTQDLKVKPGSQLDSMVAFAFKGGNFTIDVGYNMFWKDRENVWLKEWQDNTFVLTTPDYPTNTAFDPNTATLQTLNKADLDVQAAATPSLFTHKLFGGIGYTAKVYNCYPLSFGVGGSYEFATTNADLENYAVWAKIMISC